MAMRSLGGFLEAPLKRIKSQIAPIMITMTIAYDCQSVISPTYLLI